MPSDVCGRCGFPLAKDDDGKKRCLRCLRGEWRFGRVFAACPFDGPIAVLIRQFKFRGRTEVAVLGGQLLADSLQKETAQEKYDLLVPVPLHIRRLRQRGFNQSLLLAREMGRITAIDVNPHALKRHRWTMPQLGLDQKRRRLNVKGAFEVVESVHFRGKRILIIDDVLTTGCTVNECVGTLLDNGAKAVDVMTLARVG